MPETSNVRTSVDAGSAVVATSDLYERVVTLRRAPPPLSQARAAGLQPEMPFRPAQGSSRACTLRTVATAAGGGDVDEGKVSLWAAPVALVGSDLCPE